MYYENNKIINHRKIKQQFKIHTTKHAVVKYQLRTSVLF